jgi:hypothetical protein
MGLVYHEGLIAGHVMLEWRIMQGFKEFLVFGIEYEKTLQKEQRPTL